MRLLCASVLELGWLHLRQSWSLFGKLFGRIVYIDLFSITIYTITAIAVEPAFSTHDRNVSTFKRVIVKDYIAGMVGTSSGYPFRRGFLRLAIKLRCPLWEQLTSSPGLWVGRGAPPIFFREKPWGRVCFEKVYSNFQELHVKAEFLLFIEIYSSNEGLSPRTRFHLE